jgi:hypothetical protein
MRFQEYIWDHPSRYELAKFKDNMLVRNLVLRTIRRLATEGRSAWRKAVCDPARLDSPVRMLIQ